MLPAVTVAAQPLIDRPSTSSKLDTIVFKGEVNVTISCRRVATPSSVTSDSESCSSSMAVPHEFFDHTGLLSGSFRCRLYYRSRGRLLRRSVFRSFLDRRTFLRRLCCWHFYRRLFNSGLCLGECGFLCRSVCLRRRRVFPGGCLQTHSLLRPSDSSLRILKHFS